MKFYIQHWVLLLIPKQAYLITLQINQNTQGFIAQLQNLRN